MINREVEALAKTLDLYANTRLPSNYNGKTDPVVAAMLRAIAARLREGRWGMPTISVIKEYNEPPLSGTGPVEVIRVECEDDGAYTVYIPWE